MGRATDRSSPSEPPPLGGATATILFCVGLILFLALVSYTPDDVPAWVRWLNQSSAPNCVSHNFIGPVGAILAGTSYVIIGAASYLVAGLLMLFGATRAVTTKLPLSLARLGWMAVAVVSGACLLQLQGLFLRDWATQFNNVGAGGFTGQWLGEWLVRDRLLGAVGSMMFFAAAYASATALMVGFHPVRVARETITWFRERRETRRREAEEAAESADRMELDRLRIEREQRRLEKQARRQAAAGGDAEPAEASAAEAGEEIYDDRPAPRIIDSNQPLAAAPRPAKPSLAALRRGGRDRDANGGLPVMAPDARFANYEPPGTELLDAPDAQNRPAIDPEELRRVQTQVIECLDHFGIKVSAGDITRGPTITRYEVYPAKGVRVDKIVALERDIARATRAERINILAPIPGKDTVGIEIANSRKVKVALRELLESEDWHATTAKVPIALGKDVYGKTIIADLAAMPHLLVAGTTGSGKSVCINAIIASMMHRFKPTELRLIMIDPKVVEMQVYNDLPHLMVPVVTDPKKVLIALSLVVNEMEKRYKIFAQVGVRNITGFNARPRPERASAKAAPVPATAVGRTEAVPLEEVPVGDGVIASPMTSQRHYVKMAVSIEDAPPPFDGNEQPPKPQTTRLDAIFDGDRPVPEPPPRNVRDDELTIPEEMPYIVVIVDELADLMQTAPAEVEGAIARITQKARAAGIHMIVATQTPRADVVTGIIKANIPSRIAFQVASKIDSRVILDENGAERLLGQGDMLYVPPGTSRQTRAQGVLVTDEEILRMVKFCADQGKPAFEAAMQEKLAGDDLAEEDVSEEDEELVEKCIEIMRLERKASTSMFQRRLKLGYTRAARVVDIMERRGLVGPENGARGREILFNLDDDME